MAPISSSSPGNSMGNTSTQLFPRASDSDGTGLSPAGTAVLVIGIISALAILIIFFYILPRYSKSTIQWQLRRINPKPNTTQEPAQTPEVSNTDNCVCHRSRTEFIFCSFRRKKPKRNEPPPPVPSAHTPPPPPPPPPSSKKASKASSTSKVPPESSIERKSSRSHSSKRTHSTVSRSRHSGRSGRSAWTIEAYHRPHRQQQAESLTRESAPQRSGVRSETGGENAPEERQSVELRQTTNPRVEDGDPARQMLDERPADGEGYGGWNWWRWS